MLATILNTANSWIILIGGVLGILGIVLGVGLRGLKTMNELRDFFRELREDTTEAKQAAFKAATMAESHTDIIRKQSQDIARLAEVTGNLADMFASVGRKANGHDEDIDAIYKELHDLRLRMDRKEAVK